MACGNKKCQYNWRGECFCEFTEEDYEISGDPERECLDYEEGEYERGFRDIINDELKFLNDRINQINGGKQKC